MLTAAHAAGVYLLLGAAAPASAEERLALDVRGQAGAAGPVKAAAAVPAGQAVFVTLSGTISIWPVAQWRSRGSVCGAAESETVTPSPGVGNGPAGWDAETVFAVPPGVTFNAFGCEPAAVPFHSTRRSPGGIQFDTGNGFAHVEPIGGPFTSPRADHTYTYAIRSAGEPVATRFVDDPVRDNYGVFSVLVRNEEECAAASCVAAATDAPSAAAIAAGSRPTLAVLGVSLRACASRRRFRIRLRAPRGVKLASASVQVDRRRAAVIRGKRLGSVVDLRRLPEGRFVVRIVARSTRGQVLRETRRYRTCAPPRS